MADNPAQLIAEVFLETARLHEQAARQSCEAVMAVARAMTAAFAGGGQVLIFGNGGSAADAQHLATELVGRYRRVRRALPAIALTTDGSTLTAIANDESFEQVFVRQIDALGRRGDIAVGISTSGTSANVLAALRFAKARGLTTIAFTGRDGGPIGAAADLHVNVPHDATPRIQEVHRTLIHAVCELVEREL
jgi:D-sedoheptulose 7-phosphate isomerase